MAEDIREIYSSALSDALSRRQAATPSNQPEEPGQDKGKKRKVNILPSSFLKKNKRGSASSLQVWDKDIVCFLKDYITNPQEIANLK